MSVEALRALLPACAARGIPMLVANPDVVTVDAEMLVPMPGMLAQVRPRPRPVLPLSHPVVLVPPCSAVCGVFRSAAPGPQGGPLCDCIERHGRGMVVCLENL